VKKARMGDPQDDPTAGRCREARTRSSAAETQHGRKQER
jgi:hypothetical protein